MTSSTTSRPDALARKGDNTNDDVERLRSALHEAEGRLRWIADMAAMPSARPPVYTPGEAAAVLGVTVEEVGALLADGTLGRLPHIERTLIPSRSVVALRRRRRLRARRHDTEAGEAVVDVADVSAVDYAWAVLGGIGVLVDSVPDDHVEELPENLATLFAMLGGMLEAAAEWGDEAAT